MSISACNIPAALLGVKFGFGGFSLVKLRVVLATCAHVGRCSTIKCLGIVLVLRGRPRAGKCDAGRVVLFVVDRTVRLAGVILRILGNLIDMQELME